MLAQVAEHAGRTNSVLTFHLGIHVPEGAGISIAGEEHTWAEREVLVFDDSFPHAVWNRAAAPRTAGERLLLLLLLLLSVLLLLILRVGRCAAERR